MRTVCKSQCLRSSKYNSSRNVLSVKSSTICYSSSDLDILPDGRDERLDTFTNRPSRGAGEGE